ncbi:MAG TPA: hypothetical protein VK168_04595 [Saprospiraceae bacterium]|nr:hypothetical protein [Saprospiraceae bacterium]
MIKDFLIWGALIMFLSSCWPPAYHASYGEYDIAFNKYYNNLRSPKRLYQKRKDLAGLTQVFQQLQQRDTAEIGLLHLENSEERWIRLHEVYGEIQDRQSDFSVWVPASKRSEELIFFQQIDSLEMDSRKKAAAALYNKSKHLLHLYDSTAKHIYARRAYEHLSDLKTNYFRYWENANILMDSAFRAGKVHVLLERVYGENTDELSTFWENYDQTPGFQAMNWLSIYQDSSEQKRFDFHVRYYLHEFIVYGDTLVTNSPEPGQENTGFIVKTMNHKYDAADSKSTKATITKTNKIAIMAEITNLKNNKLICRCNTVYTNTFEEEEGVAANYQLSAMKFLPRPIKSLFQRNLIEKIMNE